MSALPMIHASNTILANDWIHFDTTSLHNLFWVDTFSGLTYGAIYALIALGYTLVYGLLKLINFAHSEVFISGAFAAYFTLKLCGFSPGLSYSTGTLGIIGFLVLATVVAAAVSSGVALVVERVAYKPLRSRNAPSLVFLITAIGASLTIQQIFFVWRGANAEPSIQLVIPQPELQVFSATINNLQISIVVAAIVLMFVIDQFIRRTRIGRGIRAVAQDPTTATLMGVNRERVIVQTFMIGGVAAGLAASFYIMYIPSGVVYNGGFILGIKAFVAAVLGGIGNLRGALLGGLILGLAETYGQTLFGGGWRDVVAYVLLILVLMFRPTGLLGESLGKARA
ncbi:MAG TPA: branched-chain amino acid ABC transporter permease [Jatrophihabitantaceae bacterium]|nr:branched-chain amino acid ABC transporter permease [Jatrophihabitantaceae bacterium]